MSSRRDYYDVLETDRSASQEEIKKSYRQLARKYHPDVSSAPDAEARFKEINEAYEVLSDTGKRSTYDRFGHAGLEGSSNGFGFGFRNPFDIFQEVFGRGFGFRSSTSRGPRRGADLRYDLRLTFEEAVFGGSRQIDVTRQEECAACNGSGAEPGTSPVRCSECGGTGQVRRVQKSILGSFVSVTNCPECYGEGRTISTPCSECNGQKRVRASRKLSINIPPGVDSGTQIRLVGEGGPGEYDGPPGNLYVVLDVEPHPIFQRRGDDILIELTINVAQAALGATVKVPTLGDAEEEVSIAPGTQTGTVLRLKGRGVSHLKRNGRGDQLIALQIVVPKKLSREQKRLFQELGKTLDPEAVWQEQRGFLDDLREAFGL